MKILARNLEKGMTILDGRDRIKITSVTPCGRYGQNIHINSVSCYDGQAELEVKE